MSVLDKESTVQVREILLSVEALGNLSCNEDVKVILRDVWVELKTVEAEAMAASWKASGVPYDKERVG